VNGKRLCAPFVVHMLDEIRGKLGANMTSLWPQSGPIRRLFVVSKTGSDPSPIYTAWAGGVDGDVQAQQGD
jgi:hypothetical protein